MVDWTRSRALCASGVWWQNEFCGADRMWQCEVGSDGPVYAYPGLVSRATGGIKRVLCVLCVLKSWASLRFQLAPNWYLSPSSCTFLVPVVLLIILSSRSQQSTQFSVLSLRIALTDFTTSFYCASRWLRVTNPDSLPYPPSVLICCRD